MRDRYKSLEDCLFDAFANSDWDNPQEESQLWAIREAASRGGYTELGRFQDTTARKKHECVRGCKIKSNDTYFKMQIGAAWDANIKYCAGCVAMIMYFREVWKLPRYIYTHWDEVEKRPVRREEPESD